MFSLLHGFITWFFSKTEIQILILGVDHAGKTTLLEQMKGVFQKTKGIPLDKIPPTVGLNIGRMDVGKCRVIFWDLGGQVTLRSIWDKYYAEAHGLLFVVDSSDKARFGEVRVRRGGPAERCPGRADSLRGYSLTGKSSARVCYGTP